MGDLLSEVSFGGFLHLVQGVLVDDLEGEVLDVMLNRGVGPFATNQSLSVENCVLGIGSQLILGGVADQTFSFGGESDVRGGDTVALVVGDDFDAAVLKHSDAIRKQKIFESTFSQNFSLKPAMSIYIMMQRKDSGTRLMFLRSAVLNLGYAYSWGYASSSQGIRKM